MNLEVLG